MGLIRGVARTAAIAGTATAVSNRVSRRQANKWAAQEDEQAAQQDQAAKAQAYDQQQASPPPGTARRTDRERYPPTAGLPSATWAPLQGISAAVLTEEEFAAQKAKILGS